jgi:competence protein ComEC
LAAGITALYNPSYIWGDVGWQLSFGAFAGVLVIAPLIQHYFWGNSYKPGIVMETFIGTTAAQIATMPVILLAFGTISSYALLANMLVVPLIPYAMLLTFIGGLTGVALPAAAHVVGWPAAMLMKYMTGVINWTAHLPGAQGHVNYGLITFIASYAGLTAVLWYMQRITRHRFSHEMNIVIGERT